MKTENQLDTYPLSHLQQGMLFHSLYAKRTGVDIEQIICECHESINLEAFQKAWQRILARHQVLKTSFQWQNQDEPEQVIHPVVNFLIEEKDWRVTATNGQLQQQLQAYLESDRQQGFELDQPPLMRAKLFRIGESDYWFIWTFHHALLDGRSLTIVLQEFFTFYEAFCLGEDRQLNDPEPYKNYINWLQTYQPPGLEEFWRNLLQGFTSPTPLMGTTTPDRIVEKIPGQYKIEIASQVITALETIAKQKKLTLNTFLLGAWAILLSRYSGETEVLFGATRNCRKSSFPETEKMVGLLINTVPVRVSVLPDAELLPWLEQLRSMWVKYREYEHTPIIKIQEWSNIPFGTPLFESLVIFENYSLNSRLRSLGGNWEKREFKLLEMNNYPLCLYAEQDEIAPQVFSLGLKLEYDQNRFNPEAIARMGGHLKTLLESMVVVTSQLKDLPILTEPERHQLLTLWNNTQTDYPTDLCLYQLIEAQVEKSPDAIAYSFENQQLSYRELNQKANQLAHYLRTLGVGPDVLVGISVERSPDEILGMLGILKAGGAYVPLDPAFPTDRLALIAEDAQLSVILTQKNLLNILPKATAKIVCLDQEWQNISTSSTENLANQTTSDHLAYVLYTSGSTGKPKGVQIPHRAVVNFLISMKEEPGFTSSDILLSVTTLSFDISVLEHYLPLIVGGRIERASRKVATDGIRLQELMVKSGATVLQATPATWRLLLEAEWKGNQQLKILCGGEPMSPDLAQKLIERVGSVWNMYGPTETTVWSTIYQVKQVNRTIPIGRPIANTEIYILDPSGQPVPIGISGELHIGGASVARGYLHRPELNAEKFIPNPFSTKLGDRIYKTGDLAKYLPNGEIECLGRIDFQVKIRGFRIELGEIESVLAKYPGVWQNAVTVREDIPGDKRLVAYIVPDPEQTPVVNDMKQVLKEKLPDYMVPSIFVFLESLPLTPNRKVDRRALPAPSGERQEESIFVAPSTELECQLAKIWEQILNIHPISIKDNFFELGGHSLLALRLFTQIEKVFGKNLPLATLLQAGTIEQLANIISTEEWSASWQSLVPIQTKGAKIPLFCIHPMGGNILDYKNLVPYLGEEQPVYGLQAKGLDGHSYPQNSFEEMATDYIKEMFTVQSEGPFLLIGHSSGGTIAFEIAQQLISQGHQVILVGLLDTYSPISIQMGRPKLLSKLQIFGYNLVNLPPQEKLMYIYERISTFLKPKYQKLMEKYYYGKAELAPWYMPEHIRRVQQAALAGQRKYKPQVYPGQITLFRVKEKQSWAHDLPNLGWDGLATGGIDIQDIPGTHLDLFAEPHIKILAAKLKSCIDKAVAEFTQTNG